MAKNTIADLDTTASNNTDILGQSTQGSAAVSTLDTIVQNTLGMLARFYSDVGGLGTVGGTGNAITLTSLSTYQALENGLVVTIKASAANTGATTLNVDSLGAKAVRLSGDTALVGGEMVANGVYLLRYDTAYASAAGAWVLLNPAAASADFASPAEALAGTIDDQPVAPNGLYFPTGHLYGLTLSNNASDATNDIDIAAGTARDGSDTVNMVLASALTKRLDAAWAVGTGSGGLDTGSIANGTYHVWLIKRSDTGVVDALFSTSASAPTMPTNYDYKRRIGSIIRSGAAILAFTQSGDDFWLKTPVQDASASAPISSTAVAVSVPSGIEVIAKAVAGMVGGGTATHYLRVFSPSDTDAVVATANATLSVESSAGVVFGVARTLALVKTNTSSQVQVRASSTTPTYTLNTLGWMDRRGRDAA